MSTVQTTPIAFKLITQDSSYGRVTSNEIRSWDQRLHVGQFIEMFCFASSSRFVLNGFVNILFVVVFVVAVLLVLLGVTVL